MLSMIVFANKLIHSIVSDSSFKQIAFTINIQ